MQKNTNTIADSNSFALASKVKDYFLLIKFTLSFMVVFSTVVSFLIAPNELYFVRSKIISVLLLFVAGMLITGSANAINQLLEKDTDAMMKRTANRPVASGRMSIQEGWTFAIVSGAAGILILWHFNFLTAALAAFSLF